MRLPPHKWIALSVLCRHVGVSLDTGYRWIKRGYLTAVRLVMRHYAEERASTRGRWYVERSEVERFLRAWRSGALS